MSKQLDDGLAKRVRWRRTVFLYDLFMLVALYALALCYAQGHLAHLLRNIPSAALYAAWFGALGGIAMSLRGVYNYHSIDDEHRKAQGVWSNELLYWHFGKPFGGTIVGLAVFVLLKAVVPNGDPSTVTMSAVAFVLGMQDHEFINFIKKIGAVIVSVPSSKPPNSAPTITPKTETDKEPTQPT
jgi:hypothetical protein